MEKEYKYPPRRLVTWFIDSICECGEVLGGGASQSRRSNPMKVLAIKDFPEEAKGRLKALAALRGMTIKELVILLVENEWKKEDN